MAPVTIKTSARGWREVSTSVYWTSRVMWDTGTALYCVVQDTGATPKARVMKADSRTAPTTCTEQDSANNKAITNVDYPYSSWYDPTANMLHVLVFTSTNTITHNRFNCATDLWTTGFGNAYTAASNERAIRLSVRTDGDVLAFYTSSVDDADCGWSRYEGVSWTPTANGINAANSTEASGIMDAGVDSTDRCWVVYQDCAGDDVYYSTVANGATIPAGFVAIEATGPTVETSQATGGRYNLYVDGSTDKIIAAYINGTPAIDERVISLESDGAIGNVAAEVNVQGTAGDVGVRTPISTAVTSGGTPYAVWWDDASSGTIYYSTKSGGVWAAKSTFATGITKLIEILPVSTGLAVVYQSSSDVVMDFIVSASGAASLTVAAATASAAGEAVTLDAASKLSVAEATAPAAGQAVIIKGQGRLAVDAAAAPAAGEAVTLDAASLFTVAVAAAPAAGANVTLTGQGRLPVTEATAPAAADGNLTAASLFTIGTATAPAQGEAVALNAAMAASLSVDAATAPASADSELTGQGRLEVDDAEAAAASEGVAFVAAARFTVTEAEALTQGESVTLTAGAAATLAVTPATAGAAGEAVTLDAAARLTVDAASVAAQGEDVTFDVAANLTVAAATAPAAAQAVTFAGQGRLGITEALAPAEGENVTLFGGTAIPASLTVAPATSAAAGATVLLTAGALFAVDAAATTAMGEGVTFEAAALFTISAATASAAAQTVGMVGEALLTVTPGDAQASADGTLTGAAVLILTPAAAVAQAELVLLSAGRLLDEYIPGGYPDRTPIASGRAPSGDLVPSGKPANVVATTLIPRSIVSGGRKREIIAAGKD